MSTATPSMPAAVEVDDPLNIQLDDDETDGLHRLMQKSDGTNTAKAERHAAAALFAQHLKKTGRLPA